MLGKIIGILFFKSILFQFLDPQIREDILIKRHSGITIYFLLLLKQSYSITRNVCQSVRNGVGGKRDMDIVIPVNFHTQ